MKKKKVITLAILAVTVLVMTGLSGCGNAPKEAPSKDQVEKVLKDKGFEKAKLPKDMEEPDLLYTNDSYAALAFSYAAYKDEEIAKKEAEARKEDMEGVLKVTANNEKPEVKDKNEGAVKEHTTLYKNQGCIVVRQDKTIFYICIMAPDEKGFDKALNLTKDVFEELGYKNIA